MADLSIKVTIGSRTYPLSIDTSEEENLRRAAKLVNDNIKHLQDNYAVRDKQDLLAMTALQYATKVIEGRVDTAEDDGLLESLKDMDAKLSEYLNSQ